MDKQTATPQELARLMRHQAVTSAPLSDLTAMMRYAEWLEEMPGMGPAPRMAKSPPSNE